MHARSCVRLRLRARCVRMRVRARALRSRSEVDARSGVAHLTRDEHLPGVTAARLRRRRMAGDIIVTAPAWESSSELRARVMAVSA